MSKMTKALAFFGAFNPPTAAHLGLAEFALRQTGRMQLSFAKEKADPFSVLRFAADRRIPLRRFEQEEPTLEDLFLEAVEK